MPTRLSFDVVEGSGRIYVQSMAGEPGRGLSGATTRTRYWSPSSAWRRGWLVGVLCGRRRSWPSTCRVWFGANRAGWRAFRDAQVFCGWAGGLRGCHGVVTSGAKHGGTE